MILGVADTIKAGNALIDRYQRSAKFRAYVKQHGLEIALAILVFILVTVALTGATVVMVGGRRQWLVLLALIAAPLLLVGNLALFLYTFFSWIEWRVTGLPAPQGRALTWLHGKLGVNLGRPPAAPWPLIGFLAGVPFLMLVWLSWTTAVVVALLVLAVPLVYARMDQGAASRV